MANRFLNNIRINDQYTLPPTDGSAGQSIITDGAGNLTFGSAAAASADSAESIHISVKNTSGAQILKGTPVYVTGETGNSGKIEIAPADASDSAKMPALGLLESTLDNNAEGFCVQGGLLEGLATATIDGTATTANDTVYVKPGGGLTMTKPTGTGLIQNIAKVARAHGSNGTLVVSSILRTNDVPNLTAGKIWVGDGNTVESTVVHLNEVNGRMGIGTTTPIERLDVSGDIIMTDPITLRANLKSLLGTIVSNDVVNGDFTFAMNSIVSNPIARTTIFNSYVGESMRVDWEGNVGIGTSSPQSKLHLADNNGCYTRVEALNYGSIYLGVSGPNSYISTSNSLPLVLAPAAELIVKTSSTERMRITSDGSVGIGTNSPGAKLDVVGTSNFQGDIQVSGVTFVDSTRRNIYLNSFDGGGGNGIFFRDGFTYNASITVGDHNGAAADGICISGYDGVSFSTGSNNKNEKMRISGYGNVLIGTTTDAGYKLDVNGSFITRGASYFTSGGVQISDNIYHYGDLNTYIGFPGTDTFNIYTSGGNRLHINSAGNVGIGTASPAYTLDVNGSLHSTNLNIADAIYHEGDTNTYIQFVSNDTIRWVTNGSERMRLNSSGNFGMGTTVPSAQLHLLQSNTSNTADLFKIEHNFQFLSFPPYTTTDFVVKSSGNVGIGTASPSYKLDVNGTLRSSDITIADKVIHGGDTDTYMSFPSNDTIGWYTSGGERMRINSSGNVGIGTTDPGTTRLFVNSNFSNDYGIYTAGENRNFISADLGIGTTTPSAKLDVAGGVRIADDSSTASAINAGTLRYRTSGNNSYVDMCMQTGATTYEWVNIVQNNW